MKKLIIATVLVLLASTTQVFAESNDMHYQAPQTKAQVIEVNEEDLIEEKIKLPQEEEVEVVSAPVQTKINKKEEIDTRDQRRNQNQLDRQQRLQEREERINERPRYQGHYRDENCPNYVEGEHPRHHAHKPGTNNQGHHRNHRQGRHHN